MTLATFYSSIALIWLDCAYLFLQIISTQNISYYILSAYVYVQLFFFLEIVQQ